MNNGEKETGKYFKIRKSINLGGANWIPIGGIIENSYYYTESTIKGIGSESDEIGTKNPVEDIVGVTEKSRRKYRNI